VKDFVTQMRTKHKTEYQGSKEVDIHS